MKAKKRVSELERWPRPSVAVDVVAVVAPLVMTLAAFAWPPVGTVNVGEPVVLVPPDPELPQADTPPARPAPRARAATILVTRTRAVIDLTSGRERFHAPAAMRAVVQVLLRQLVAPVAEAQIVNRPWQV